MIFSMWQLGIPINLKNRAGFSSRGLSSTLVESLKKLNE